VPRRRTPDATGSADASRLGGSPEGSGPGRPRVARPCLTSPRGIGAGRPRLFYRDQTAFVTPARSAPIASPRPPRSPLLVRARLRDVAMWFVTAIDDIIVERTWRALRRGKPRVAVQTWRDLVLGFPGCALPILAVLAGLLVWLVVR
jgi:hypothetical protein